MTASLCLHLHACHCTQASGKACRKALKRTVRRCMAECLRRGGYQHWSAWDVCACGLCVSMSCASPVYTNTVLLCPTCQRAQRSRRQHEKHCTWSTLLGGGSDKGGALSGRLSWRTAPPRQAAPLPRGPPASNGPLRNAGTQGARALERMAFTRAPFSAHPSAARRAACPQGAGSLPEP